MAVERFYFTWTIKSGEDLSSTTSGSGPLGKAVALDDGKIAVNGKEAGGILMHGGKNSGDQIEIGYAGIMKGVAGAAISAGARVTVNGSGYFVTATSGTYVVGRCLDTAAVSGGFFTGAFNFATVAYFGDSGEAA